jgi:hypothetical protein
LWTFTHANWNYRDGGAFMAATLLAAPGRSIADSSQKVTIENSWI